jgi:ubiquinone/menaquinone biosynthesis C-methylase UbiE
VPDQHFAGVPVDSVREFWNRRPCNIRHSSCPVGTREYFDEVEARKYFVEPHIPAFADFPRWQGKKVLEIGCGIGTDTISFARHGAAVTAIDLSDKSVELACRRAEIYGVSDRVRFYCGNCEELDRVLPAATYDLVYSFGVIHHTPRPEKAVEQVRKFMGAASELRVMVYSKVSYKLFWVMKEAGIWDMSRMDALIAENSEAQSGCPVTYTYTQDEARRLLAGFEILEMRKAHIFTWDVDAYRRYEYRKDAAWGKVSDERLAELEKELGWHLLVRARLAQPASLAREGSGA